MNLPSDHRPSSPTSRPKLSAEARRARQADRLRSIRLRLAIGRALEDRGISTPAAIGDALGMRAQDATKLLIRHQWREGDVAARSRGGTPGRAGAGPGIARRRLRVGSGKRAATHRLGAARRLAAPAQTRAVPERSASPRWSAWHRGGVFRDGSAKGALLRRGASLLPASAVSARFSAEKPALRGRAPFTLHKPTFCDNGARPAAPLTRDLGLAPRY
jgi:hypothetical protein